MKNLRFLILFLFSLVSAKGAITVSNSSLQEFTDLLGLYSPAFIAEVQAGGISGQNSKELLMSATNSSITNDVTWSFPASIFLYYDNAGNVGLQSGVSGVTDQPLYGFNTLLIRLKDNGSFPAGGASFNNIIINSVNVRDMFADEGYDYIKINLGQISPQFQLTGDVDFGFGGGNATGVEIYALNIPEPNVFLLTILPFVLFLRRKR